MSLKPCTRDQQCYWNHGKRKCFSKKTQQAGVPILECPPARTSSPTGTPTITPPPSGNVCIPVPGWIKVDDKKSADCFLDSKFKTWGWANGPYHLTKGKNDKIEFTIYAGAEGCDTSKGFVAGEGKLAIDKYGHGKITYKSKNKDIVFGEIKAYIGTNKFYLDDKKPTVTPEDLPLTIDCSPFIVPKIPSQFYFYIYFEVKYGCDDEGLTKKLQG